MVGGMKVVVGVGRKVEEGREHGVKGEMVETEEVKPESGTKEKVEGMDLGGMQDKLLRSQAVVGEPLLREFFVISWTCMNCTHLPPACHYVCCMLSG